MQILQKKLSQDREIHCQRHLQTNCFKSGIITYN